MSEKHFAIRLLRAATQSEIFPHRKSRSGKLMGCWKEVVLLCVQVSRTLKCVTGHLALSYSKSLTMQPTPLLFSIPHSFLFKKTTRFSAAQLRFLEFYNFNKLQVRTGEVYYLFLWTRFRTITLALNCLQKCQKVCNKIYWRRKDLIFYLLHTLRHLYTWIQNACYFFHKLREMDFSLTYKNLITIRSVEKLQHNHSRD